MDGSRFDNLTRSLAMSRRSVLKQLAVGLLAGVSGLGGAALTGAQGCLGIRQRCASDSECCDGFCDPASGRCACPAGTESCGGVCVPLEQYQSDVENCGGCRTRCRRAPECQSAACIAGVCGSVPDPAQEGAACRAAEAVSGVSGVCASDGSCVCPVDLPAICGRSCVDTSTDTRHCGACDHRCPEVPHATATCAGGVCGFICDGGYSECGGVCCPDSRNCCNGVCCGPGECCGDGICSAEACAPHCVINGQWIADGTINPNNACEICDRDRSETDWSVAVSGTPCGEPGECCNLGICAQCGCQINGALVVPGALNPDNPCERCDPVQDPGAWSLVSDESCGTHQVCCAGVCCDQGECCGVSGACVACRCVIENVAWDPGAINPYHDCEYCDHTRDTTDWTIVDDRTRCGGTPGRICCNGDCCSPTECCTPTGCVECGPLCRIGDDDVLKDGVNPADQCQACNPEIRIYDWSDAPDDFPCGGLDDDRVCCRGICCEPGECCDDGCYPCRCQIGGFPWDDGTRNPFNHCLVCDPSRDKDDWSYANNGALCGDNDERQCCEGQCCPRGQCCNDIGECEDCPCRINGQNVLDGVVNPLNTCQVCNAGENREDWTALSDGEACGTDADDRVCCGGECCPQGQCCEDGACVDCGCEIEGEPVAPGVTNPGNSCQICIPSNARLSWSPVENGEACGTEEGQRCCGGACCAANECCILDACGTCLCNIDGQNVAATTTNPDNVCEACDPENDPFGWSPRQGAIACGDGQVCCSGSCCDAGLCCLLGVCQFCGCKIDEVDVGEFAINPDNECQWCDPVVDPFNWSPRSDEPCGDGGAQICCGGICCPDGMCCGLADTCEPCPCEIGGVVYVAGTANPDNPCQVCDSLNDRFGWSLAEDNTACGSAGDRFCCGGSCCAGGECCHALDGACGAKPCHCSIGESDVNEGDANPQNECERCDPRENPTGWTQLADDTPCGESGTQVCCSGSCCAEGDCCTLGVCQFCGCLIDGVSRVEGEPNPDNSCQVCDPVLDPFAWSPVADDSACGVEQVCCGGICCGPDQCCGLSGVCGSCDGQCTIGGQTYSAGTPNPQNGCEVCDPIRSTTAWSFTPDNGVCGGSDGQVCCDGDCCPANFCCINGRCEIEGCNDPCIRDPDSCQCEIGGATYPNGAFNPANLCERCDFHSSATAWSPVWDYEPCGPEGLQYCCQGTCCADGECCTPDGACSAGGASACNGCDIGGRFYRAFEPNPDNDCEICSPTVSTTSWSTVNNNVSCGENRDGKCCNGACCSAGLCCGGTGSDATCQACGCEIDGATYLPGQLNPANPCVFCDPGSSSSGWTINSELEFCTFDFGRECCGGVCCPYDTCCGFSGQCEEIEFNLANCIYWQ